MKFGDVERVSQESHSSQVVGPTRSQIMKSSLYTYIAVMCKAVMHTDPCDSPRVRGRDRRGRTHSDNPYEEGAHVSPIARGHPYRKSWDLNSGCLALLLALGLPRFVSFSLNSELELLRTQ